MKYLYVLFSILITYSVPLFAVTDSTLQVLFSFDNINKSDTAVTDDSGNNYIGTLKRGASFKEVKGIGGVLALGDDYGYLDLGSKLGTNVISKLEDFTISTYIYIAEDAEMGYNIMFEFGEYKDNSPGIPGSMHFTTLQTGYIIGYGNEAIITARKVLAHGSWHHVAVTYDYDNTTANIYIDGILCASSSEIKYAPKDIGVTTYNALGGSSFSSEVCLTKTLIDEFRIYNVALPDSMITKLAASLETYNNTIISLLLNKALDKIQLTNGARIKSNLSLPVNIDGYQIKWHSSDSNAISSDGTVTRPKSDQPEINIVLTATAISGDSTTSKQFNFIVDPLLSDKEALEIDTDNLQLDSKINCLHSDIDLPKTGLNGSIIEWATDMPNLIDNNGKLLYRPSVGSGQINATLTATITQGSESNTKKFEISVAEKDPYSAYLFVHFKENYESIRFAISDDAYTYIALNNDNPVLDSKIISSTGGVRDPHILRGQDDKTFYMVATDMKAANGWNSNRGLVLLKSTNLIDWQSSVVNIAKTYPTLFSDIQNAWAPQTIYDKTKGKYMIYWAMRKGVSGKHKMYYAYANESFTALESAPAILFERANNASVIDADILERNGIFYLFYKTEGDGAGIKKAVSSSVTGPYVEVGKYLDKNDMCVEGSCIFRLINSDTYIMMYDAYCQQIYQFTSTTDLTNFTVIDSLITMDFTPKHGTIIPLKREERDALLAKWNPTSSSAKHISDTGKLIATHIYLLNGLLTGKDITQLPNGIYIRKQIYTSGAIKVDKLLISNR